MARILCCSIAVLALSAPAQAFWFGASCMDCGDQCGCQQGQTVTAMDHCQQITGANRRWPSPYVCPDRVYAHAPFNAMISNGWRRQNLMGNHHFNPEATKLTQAGELKIRWIMTQAPVEYRRMFVERSVDPEVTRRRMQTVTEFAELIALNEPSPQVVETHILSEGRPAAAVDFVNTQFRDNQRPPVLPAVGLGNEE